MKISPERLKEFREIFKREYGHDFKDESEAQEAAQNLLGFFEVLYEIAQKDYIRKQKLKKLPKGFPIDDDGIYTCWVCFASITKTNGWYDQYGLKCLNCQRATENGILPSSVFNDRSNWLSLWNIEKEFKVPPITTKKLIREGKIRARVIKQEDGTPYYYVILKNENVEFLQKLKS